MLDFRLRVFYTVAKMLNFTKAATSLEISQPAVTKHIKELEQSYKVTLFDRQPNAMALTEAGEILLRHATEIIEQYDRIQFDIDNLQHPVTGNLNIGATPTVARHLLPGLVAGFRAQYPKVKVQIDVNNNINLISQLTDNKLTVSFTGSVNKDLSLKYIPYLQDDILLVCSNTSAGQKKPSMGVNDLAKLSFLQQEDDTDTVDIVVKSLKDLGLPADRLHIDFRLPDTEMVKNFLAASGQSYAFLPRHTVTSELANGTLRSISIDGFTPSISYHIATTTQETTPALAAFLHHIGK